MPTNSRPAGPTDDLVLTRPRTRLVKWGLRAVTFAVLAYFLTRHLHTHWGALDHVLVAPRWGWILLGSVLMALGMVVTATAYRFLITDGHGSLTLKKAIPLFCAPQVGKYVPGKVGVLLGAAWGATRLRLSKRAVVLAVTGLAAGQTIAGLLFALGAVAMTPVVSTSSHRLACAFLVLLLLAPAHPRLFGILQNRISRGKLGALYGREQFDRWTPCKVIAVCALGWLGQGLGFACFALAFGEFSFVPAVRLTLAFPGACTAGFLAVFLPAGLGVRDALLAAALSPILPVPRSIAVAGITRLWTAGIDVVMSAIGYLLITRYRGLVDVPGGLAKQTGRRDLYDAITSRSRSDE